MQTISIDCAGLESMDEFWQRYLDVVRPDGAQHFGRNLNAFWDAIDGGGPGWPGPVKLVFVNSTVLSALPEGSGPRSFLTCLQEIATEATAVQIEFA